MTLEEAQTKLTNAFNDALDEHDLTEDQRLDIEEYLFDEAQNQTYGHGIPSTFDYTRVSEVVRDVIAPFNNALSSAVEAYLMTEAA